MLKIIRLADNEIQDTFTAKKTSILHFQECKLPFLHLRINNMIRKVDMKLQSSGPKAIPYLGQGLLGFDNNDQTDSSSECQKEIESDIHTLTEHEDKYENANRSDAASWS